MVITITVNAQNCFITHLANLPHGVLVFALVESYTYADVNLDAKHARLYHNTFEHKHLKISS